MIDFISKNWQILTAMAAGLAYLYRQVSAMRSGLRALLRADLIRLHNKYYDELHYCPIYVKRALEDEYKEYHTLKGNGVGTNMYEDLMDLPTKPPEQEE